MEIPKLIDQYAEEIKSSACINWIHINELFQQIDNKTGLNLFKLVDLIRNQYEDDMISAKKLLKYKSQSYDCVLARLQYMEEQEQIQVPKNATSNSLQDITTESKQNFEILSMSLCSDKFIQFSFDKSFDDEKIVKETCDKETQTISDNNMYLKIQELIRQNKEYLKLGLNWKKRCEIAEKSILELSEKHNEEIERLTKLIYQIPTFN